MAVWRDHLLPRIVDKACPRRDFAVPRRRTLSGLSDDVVEIGFGSGHNLTYYPSRSTGSSPSNRRRWLDASPSRVPRPGGRLHFVEHGLSPDPKVAAWQHRLTPIQRRACGGCHFDRPIAQPITDAGFRIVTLENSYLPGPKTPSYLYQGVAEAS